MALRAQNIRTVAQRTKGYMPFEKETVFMQDSLLSQPSPPPKWLGNNLGFFIFGGSPLSNRNNFGRGNVKASQIFAVHILL